MALPEFSISDWQQGMARGEWTSAGLVEGFPSRIAELDFAGPRLRSAIELNPDAMQIAEALDQATYLRLRPNRDDRTPSEFRRRHDCTHQGATPKWQGVRISRGRSRPLGPIWHRRSEIGRETHGTNRGTGNQR
jgi:hypothetical protein